MIVTQVDSNPCYINLTNNARADIDRLFSSEEDFEYMNSDQIFKELISLEKAFLVHL